MWSGAVQGKSKANKKEVSRSGKRDKVDGRELLKETEKGGDKLWIRPKSQLTDMTFITVIFPVRVQ